MATYLAIPFKLKAIELAEKVLTGVTEKIKIAPCSRNFVSTTSMMMTVILMLQRNPFSKKRLQSCWVQCYICFRSKNRPPTFQTCHQHKLSPTSLTSIDVVWTVQTLNLQIFQGQFENSQICQSLLLKLIFTHNKLSRTSWYNNLLNVRDLILMNWWVFQIINQFKYFQSPSRQI